MKEDCTDKLELLSFSINKLKFAIAELEQSIRLQKNNNYSSITYELEDTWKELTLRYNNAMICLKSIG